MKFNNVEYGGQNYRGLTYTITAGAVAGDAVTNTAAGTAGRGADGGPLLGKFVVREADNKGTVQNGGVIVVPWTGAAVFGQQTIVVDGTGKAKVGAGGRACEVIGVANNLAVINLG